MKFYYLIILLFFGGCDTEKAIKINMSDTDSLSITNSNKSILKCAGCKTEYYLIKELSEGYGEKIKVNPTGNGIAVKQILKGESDFIDTCKSLKVLSNKIPELKKRENEFDCTVIAKDVIAIIINKDNQVTNLSLQIISDIYSGKITKWSEVGWAEGGKITPIIVDQRFASGTATIFKEMTIGAKGKYSSKSILSPSDSEMPELINKFPNMIGYCVLSKTPDSVKKIKISNIAPEIENVLNGSYPLITTYHLIFPRQHSKQLAGFLEFVDSKKGKEIINKNFISSK